MEVEMAKEIIKYLKDTPGFIEMIERNDRHWFSSLSCARFIDIERSYNKQKKYSGWEYDPYAHGLPLKYTADAVLGALNFVNVNSDEFSEGGSYYAVYWQYPNSPWYIMYFKNIIPEDFFEIMTSSGLGWIGIEKASWAIMKHISELSMLFDTQEKAEDFIKNSQTIKRRQEDNPGIKFKVRKHSVKYDTHKLGDSGVWF